MPRRRRSSKGRSPGPDAENVGPTQAADSRGGTPVFPAAGSASLRVLVPVAAALVVVVLAVFLPVYDNPFLNWDDDQNYAMNKDVRGLTWDNFQAAWTAHRMGVWQPLAWIAAAAQWELFTPQNPEAFSAVMHTVNVVWHAMTVVLLFLVIHALLRRARPDTAARHQIGTVLAAAAGALLYGIHPLRVEAVAWATGQPYILAALLALAAIWCYLRAVAATSLDWHITAVACFTLAALTKAIVVPLPVILLVLDVYPLRRLRASRESRWETLNRILIEKLPYVAISAVAVAFAIWATYADRAADALHAPPLPLEQRLVSAAYSMMFCLVANVAPLDLAPVYLWPVPFHGTEPWFVAAAAGFVLITAVSLVLWRRAPWLLASWIVFVVVLLPVSGLVKHGGQLTADRYTYLASMPWAALFAGGLLLLWQRVPGRSSRAVTGVCVLLVAIALAVSTIRQAGIWESDVRVWGAIAAENPDYAQAHYNLARAQRLSGDMAAARPSLERAVALLPGYAEAHVDLGAMLNAEGEREAAIDQFELALRARPGFFMAHYNLAYVYYAMRELPLAIRHFERAREGAARVGAGRIVADIDAKLPQVRAAAERLRGRGVRRSPATQPPATPTP